MTQLLEGKTALVFGVANDHSIAWGIARALHQHGARLAFSYAVEKLERRVRPLAESVGADFIEPCDVSRDDEIEALFSRAASSLGKIDVLIHAIAYAGRDELSRPFLETSRSGFLMTMDISVYSLTALARAAAPMMPAGGSMLTLTYDAGQKVVPHYNVMGVAKAALESSMRYLANDLGPRGIRVNAISAGPVRTLAAAGVAGFKKMYGRFAELAPLRRNISLEDIGATAVWLSSDMAASVTGEVIFVDSGYNILGVPYTDDQPA
ncbi:MAG TPA: enoyl-ACP reductase [Anaerolineales bacterium]|nr:enoyl-ACP reductase [Anaerolineales bacterium]